MNGTIKTYDEYRKLTVEQKEFYTFQMLDKISCLHKTMLTLHEDLDKKYASKLTQKLVYGMVGVILFAFMTAVVTGFIPVPIR